MLVFNYTGDRLNFGLATEQARREGRKVGTGAQFFGEFSHWGFGLCILSSTGACNWEEVQRDIGLRKLLEGAQLIFVGDRLSKAQLFSWCAGPGDKLHWGPDPLWACH